MNGSRQRAGKYRAGTFPRQPVFDILREQGRLLTWLARKSGYSHSHVKAVAAGIFPPSAKFRKACADALGLPEADLFNDAEPVAA
jgi:lambda repressor-like predicted transcriptional regulator